MGLTAKLQIPQIDVSSYRTATHDRLSETITEAAKAWIDNAEGIIPVWSGASRATFLDLANKVGYQLMIDPVAASRIELGYENGVATFTANKEESTYSFSYSTSLAHLIINEYYDATQWGFHLKRPGPYHFQEAGRNALRRITVSMPTLKPFIQKKSVRVG